MTILDAYAVIAFLRAEAAADAVEPLIRDGHSSLTAVGLAEVIDRMVRLAHADEDDVVLDLIQLGLYDAIPTDTPIAGAAGRLRARRYHRTQCPVSMADCVAAETARTSRQPLATADPDLLDVCYREDIDLVALPGSDGSVWQPPPESQQGAGG